MRRQGARLHGDEDVRTYPAGGSLEGLCRRHPIRACRFPDGRCRPPSFGNPVGENAAPEPSSRPLYRAAIAEWSSVGRRCGLAKNAVVACRPSPQRARSGCLAGQRLLETTRAGVAVVIGGGGCSREGLGGLKCQLQCSPPPPLNASLFLRLRMDVCRARHGVEPKVGAARVRWPDEQCHPQCPDGRQRDGAPVRRPTAATGAI